MWEMDDGLSKSNLRLKKNKLEKVTSRSIVTFLNKIFSLEFDSHRNHLYQSIEITTD